MIGRVCKWVGETCSYIFFICMLIIAYEVVMRYVLNAPTVWAHDLITALCAVGFLISGVYTLYRRAHIRISIIYEKLPRRVQRWLDVFNGVITLTFLGLLGYQSTFSAAKSIRIMETAGTASQLPLPPIIKTAMVVACVLMFALALVHTWRALQALRGHEPL